MSVLESAHRFTARACLRLWPFPFAHLRLMRLLGASPPKQEYYVSGLRGFPLRLKFEPQSYIGHSLYFRGMYEEQVVGKLASLLKPGMTFLDVGANIGLHTTVAAHRVGPTGRVLAIEPQQGPLNLLQQNIALNGLKNVTVVKCGLGATEGTMELFQLSKTNSGMATLAASAREHAVGSETVDVKRLTTIAAQTGIDKIDAVKIDVEGAEMEVLLGADDFLSHHRPAFMLIECVDKYLARFGASSAGLVEYLRNRGYDITALHRGRWEPVQSADGLAADILAVRRG